MTAEVVSLRRVRKVRQRAARADAASENRIKHGRTAAERQALTLETSRVARLLDGHRVAPDDSV